MRLVALRLNMVEPIDHMDKQRDEIAIATSSIVPRVIGSGLLGKNANRCMNLSYLPLGTA